MWNLKRYVNKLSGQLDHCPHHPQRFDEAKAFPLALIAAA